MDRYSLPQDVALLDMPRRMGEGRTHQGWSGSGKAGGVDCTLDCQRSEVSPSQETPPRCTHAAHETSRDGVGQWGARSTAREG